MALAIFFSEMKKDKIIIIAAHGFDTHKYPIFNHVITMNNGKIIECE